MPRTPTVDVVGFAVDNVPLFNEPSCHWYHLPPLRRLPLLPRPGVNIVEYPLIQGPCTQFLPPWLPILFLFHRWPPIPAGFIPGITSKQMQKIVYVASKQFLKRGDGGPLISQLWSKPQKQRTTFSSGTINGLLTKVRIRMYRVHRA